MNNFLLLDVVIPHMTIKDQTKRLQELIDLTATYGKGDVVKIIQQKIHPDPATYIGSGKLHEVLTTIIPEFKIKTIIANEILKPKQLFNIKQALWDTYPDIEVWDRVDLILHIFKNHARTAESQLQIELASMRHMGPRIYNLSGMLGRQRGGRGSISGSGETNTREMQTHWKKSIAVIEKRLEKLEQHQMRQMQRRRELGFQTVSIVGYTNAGKSTLFKRLSGKQAYIKDELFATLDSTTAKLYLTTSQRSVLISDTIGFIRDLPPELIAAFKSTLLETIHADILVHVVDASDPELESKIHTVNDTLAEINASNTPTIIVFNKIDKATEMTKGKLEHLIEMYTPIFISATSGEGIPNLIKRIEEVLSKIPPHNSPLSPTS